MYRLTKIFDWLKPKLERIGVGFNFSFKKTAILFAILIILSGALRWIRVIEVQLLERDEIVYVEAAERWLSGGFSAVYSDESMTVPPLLLFLTQSIARLMLLPQEKLLRLLRGYCL